MNFRDQYATDEEGKQFVFTIEMQRALVGAGVTADVATYLEWRKTNAPKAAPNPKERRNERRNDSQYDFEIAEDMQIDPVTGKFIGVLKNYNNEKGFGFIFRGGTEEIYFNKKRAIDSPEHFNVGQKLLYTENEFRGKLEAVDVEEYLE